MNGTMQRILILGLALLLLAACRGEENRPWVPVLEETDFPYLDSSVSEALENLARAERALATDRKEARRELAKSRQWLLKLQRYYLPLTEVRQFVYDADRLYYLKRREEAAEKLAGAKERLIRMGEGATLPLEKELAEVVLAIDALSLAMRSAPEDVPPLFAKLGERINLMLLKGELVLAGTTFVDRQ